MNKILCCVNGIRMNGRDCRHDDMTTCSYGNITGGVDLWKITTICPGYRIRKLSLQSMYCGLYTYLLYVHYTILVVVIKIVFDRSGEERRSIAHYINRYIKKKKILLENVKFRVLCVCVIILHNTLTFLEVII